MGYVLYGGVRSRAFRCLWMLEELDVPYEHVPTGPHAPDLRRINPAGKVPVLVDGDAVLTDSSAILTYLADKHGALTAAPGSLDRAHQDAWLFRILDELEGQLWTAAKHSFILPESERVPEVKAACRAEFGRNLERLCTEMTGPYVAGAHFTLPDIVLTHCGRWAAGAKFPDPPAAFAAYLDRIQDRPAFKAVLAKGAAAS